MEGNAPLNQVNPVSRISGEGRAEFLRTWGADFDKKKYVLYELGKPIQAFVWVTHIFNRSSIKFFAENMDKTCSVSLFSPVIAYCIVSLFFPL